MGVNQLAIVYDNVKLHLLLNVPKRPQINALK